MRETFRPNQRFKDGNSIGDDENENTKEDIE